MKCLIYVTKSKPWLFFDKSINYYSLSNKKIDNDLNGKIVAVHDYELEEIRDMIQYKYPLEKAWHVYLTPNLEPCELKERSCLTSSMLDKYKPNYAIHIKNLKVFENPYELDCFYRYDGEKFIPLKRAPQNMCYAFDKYGNKYVLISVRPEWACKILNGEKTIEVRKKVLNCMKGD